MGKLLTDPKPGDFYSVGGTPVVITSVDRSKKSKFSPDVDGVGEVCFEYASGTRDSYSGNWNFVVELGVVVKTDSWWV